MAGNRNQSIVPLPSCIRLQFTSNWPLTTDLVPSFLLHKSLLKLLASDPTSLPSPPIPKLGCLLRSSIESPNHNVAPLIANLLCHQDTMSTKPSESHSRAKKPPIWWSNTLFFVGMHVTAVLGVMYFSPWRKLQAPTAWCAASLSLGWGGT